MAGTLLTNDALLWTMFGAEDHVWSVGTLGAFMALPHGVPEVRGDALILSDPECVARLLPGGQLLAFETLSSDPRGWNHGIALCLPASATQPRRLVRIAEDVPVRPSAPSGPVFDLGLGHGPVRALFQPETALRVDGMGWDDAAPLLAATPGTWIIDTPILRVEKRTTEGVGFFSVKQALTSARGHAETTPVPPGLVPVAHVFPPHPARSRPGTPAVFDPARHASFQSILTRHGRADLRALKSEVLAQLAAGRFDPPATDRHGATVVRVALRQHLQMTGDAPRDWLAHYDRPLLRLLEQWGS